MIRFRLPGSIALRTGVALAAMCVGAALSPLLAQTPPEAGRISFQIATGPVSGSHLPVGEAIAFVISHPPGLGRCAEAGVCGPEGLIATTRSSGSDVASALAVHRGSVQSAIVPAHVAAAARAGAGPFQASGPLSDLRAIARLNDDSLHFVVPARSGIRRLRDLAGKRILVDSSDESVEMAVRALLAAGKVPASRVRIRRMAPARALEDLRTRRADAYFTSGVAPVRNVAALLRRGEARLVAVEARILSALARRSAAYGRLTLPAGTYGGTKPIATVGLASVWVVSRARSDREIHDIVRSLWHPANREELRRRAGVSDLAGPPRAATNLPLPLHPGARAYYAEAAR